MKILFFILLQLTDIYSTREFSLENEITKSIDKWVASIFTTGGNISPKIMLPIYDNEVKEFEHNISNQENNIHKKFIFQNIVFHEYKNEKNDRGKVQQIIWKFSENKIVLGTFIAELNFYLNAVVMLRTDWQDHCEESSEVSVQVYPTFKNFTSTVVKSYSRGDDLSITYDFTYNTVGYRSEIWYSNEILSNENKKLLMREITPIMPDILKKSLNNNQTFIQKLNDDVFLGYDRPRQEIISMLPDFMTNSQKYYYLIPRIPFFCFILKRVVIHGLSNFESYEVHGEQGIFTHTLLIRNIQGSMTLDYRSEKEKPLKLNFQIDCFLLSKKDDVDCVQARAKYYTITRRKTNTSLSSRQSEVIINRLETALASGLFGLPSKEIGHGQICNIEMPLEKIKISNSSDWKTIKESYKGWIPFNEEEEI